MAKSIKNDGFSLSWLLVGGGILILGLSVWLAMAKAGGNDGQSADDAEAAQIIAASGFNEGQRKGIEAIVRQYLVENPEVIEEALTELQTRDVRGRVDAVRADMEKPFFGAFIGPIDAPITLVEFTDYNCGFCRSSMADVERLVKDNPDVRVVFRETPILTASSQTAALWAFAAAEQGKYPAFHRALFNGGRVTDSSIAKAAAAVGLDIEKAKTQIVQGSYKNEIEANLDMMRALGVGGTPTFVVGDEIIEGAAGYDALQAAVVKARGAK